MTRDPNREAVELRQRLRDTEVRLRLLASAVVTQDPGAPTLARVLLGSVKMEMPGEPEAPADIQSVSRWPDPSDSKDQP